jgi:hypothetical protein
MTGMLSEPGIGWRRVCEIPGLSPASLVAILAEAGDLHRYASSSSLVKHAGMSPARNESAAFRGKTAISRRGRPGLRLAAWRATWAVLRHCDVLAAKHAALTSWEKNKLKDAQARAACAASVLRWIYSLIVHRTSWDPWIAAGQFSHHQDRRPAAPPADHPWSRSGSARVTGGFISSPRAVSGTDADGRPLWHKLTVYACNSARHGGEPVHRAISRRLHAAGLDGVITLRGLWGFRGDRAARGRLFPG